MTSETSRRSRSFFLQKQTNLASLATMGSVRPTILPRSSQPQKLTHLPYQYSSYRTGRWRYYRSWIWPPCCVPGRRRSRDRRHARYALGHDPCSFAGSEEARQKSQGRRLAQVAIASLLFFPLFDNTNANLFRVFWF